MEAEIVSTRTTFDNVTVYLYANGEVGSRVVILRGKLPVEKMWRVWADICTYTWDEIPALIRSVRKGTWIPSGSKPAIDHEALMAVNRQRRVERCKMQNECRKVRGLKPGEW